MAGRVRPQTSQQDCEPAPETSSVSLLDEDPEPLSQQLQVTRARSTESLDSLTLSPGIPVALEYLPFFRTSGQLQDNGLLTPQPAIYKDKGEAPALTLAPAQAPEDAAQPSGFFPYYHSQEECFPSLALPDWPHRASQDPVPNREAQMGCFCKMTARDICTAASAGLALTSGSSHTLACCCPPLPASAGCSRDGGPAAQLTGFMSYYRSLEERLHTSPGPPTPPSGSQRVLEGLGMPDAATP